MKHTHSHPLVSVVMPVFNSKKYIRAAVESMVTQSYRPIEVIAVDDHSTDGTWKILQQLAAEYPDIVRVVRQAKNAGPTKATNRALSLATGRYIAVMDSDDVSHPERIAKQVAHMLKNPEIVVLGTHAAVINQSGEVIGTKEFPTEHEEIYRMYGEVHPIVHPSIMINKELVPKAEQCYKDKFGIHADYYNMFRFLQFGHFANLPEQLLYYRVHGENNSLKNLKHSYWVILLVRIEAMIHLGFQMTVRGFLLMCAQTAVALATPEKLLKWMYVKVKGFKDVKI